MMMAMISSVSLSRQGARTEFLVPGIGFLVVAAQRTCFAEFSEPPRYFSSRRSYRRKERPRRCRRRPDATQAWPGLGPRLGAVWPTPGPSAPLLLTPWVFWENRAFGIFSGIFPER